MALGLLCSYITICLYFYIGQWQLVLHPSHAEAATPASQQLAFETVRFGDDRGGQPQIAAWWIPSAAPSDSVALLLPGGSGNKADALPFAKALHDARLNVLLFDYRGFGQSGGDHPTQKSMEEDASNALAYLLSTRGFGLPHLVVFGTGLGASVATTLCVHNANIPALILAEADGDTTTRVEAAQKSHIVPVGMIFHERFPLADNLARLQTPKLLISFTKGPAPVFAQRAAFPKTTVELPPGDASAHFSAAIRTFLDRNLMRSAPVLLPKPE